MARISDEMTIRDIAEAINAGVLDREDPEVKAAVKSRLRATHAASAEVFALIDPEELADVLDAAEPLAEVMERLHARRDCAKIDQAKRALGRLEDALGPEIPGKKRYPSDGEAP
jgi:hypothetical protein